jgi:hypothetical protein
MASVDDVTKSVEPILNTVDSTVVSTVADQITKPGFFAELGYALIVLVLVIVFHGWCMAQISRYFGSRFARFNSATRQWRVSLLMSTTIALLALSHLAETFIWALPIWLLGLIPNLRDAYYFVLEAYTTLGESTVTLPESWRLLGPLIAISGLFTFSWTGSVLVYVMTEIGRRHAHAKPPASQHPPSSAPSAASAPHASAPPPAPAKGAGN